MSIVFSEEYSGLTKKSQAIYIVKPDRGAVACSSQEIYKNIQNFFLNNDLKSISNEIKNKNCIILKKGDELEALEQICDVEDKNSVKLFKSKKVFLQKIYVPCFAVEMKEIIKKSENDDENMNQKDDSKPNKIQQNLDKK